MKRLFLFLYLCAVASVQAIDIVPASVITSDTAYNATSWNANTDVPTKNAVRDILETIIASATAPSDTAYDATSWDGVTTIAPTKNAVRDKIEAVVASIPAAPSGGVIGTAQLLIADPNVTLSHPLGVLASGITASYDSIGKYTITDDVDFAADQREFVADVTVFAAGAGEQLVASVENTGNNSFVIYLRNSITGDAADPVSGKVMISIQTVSQ